VRSRRSLVFGWLIGLVFYVCYAAAQRRFPGGWGNPVLIATALFIATNVPRYSRLSSRIEEYLQFVSATVTLGRLGRFAFQMAFNISVYALFVAGDVVTPLGVSALGGVFGAALLTTLASQGFQYAGQTAARFGYGQPDWNVLVGLSANVFLASLALAGFPAARATFVVSAILFGALVFLVGLASDFRAILWPAGGIAVFFGTFNPFHKSHLDLVRRALVERKVAKVVIHPTIIPKSHAQALARGEIKVARVENGLEVYERTEKGDPLIDYFPTGNRFYRPEDRKWMIELAIKDAGLADKVEVAFMPEIYREQGFRGIFREIIRHHPGRPIHGIHGSDIGGMMVRTIMDESGWYYPLSVRRKDNISATAIRAGALGMTTASVTLAMAELRDGLRLRVPGWSLSSAHGSSPWAEGLRL
jgi:hypothetical protein